MRTRGVYRRGEVRVRGRAKVVGTMTKIMTKAKLEERKEKRRLPIVGEEVVITILERIRARGKRERMLQWEEVNKTMSCRYNVHLCEY